jgi:hypothetical protein
VRRTYEIGGSRGRELGTGAGALRWSGEGMTPPGSMFLLSEDCAPAVLPPAWDTARSPARLCSAKSGIRWAGLTSCAGVSIYSRATQGAAATVLKGKVVFLCMHTQKDRVHWTNVY